MTNTTPAMQAAGDAPAPTLDRRERVVFGRRISSRAITFAGLGAYIFAFSAAAAAWGLPWSRDRLAIWLVLGLLAISLTDLRGWARGVLIDWSPLFAVLFAYDLLRGYADGLVSSAHFLPQLEAEQWLFGGMVPTVELQEAFYRHGDPQWYDYAAWAVYTSHFFATLAVAAVLWRFAYHHFRPFVAKFVTLTAAGFATYVLFPAAPPWLASKAGPCAVEYGADCYLEPTTRLVGQMWGYVGIDAAAQIFQGGSRYANDVAALPSLHSAYPMLLLLFLWPLVGRIGKALLVAYPWAMSVTLVYGAEHYFVDILLGWAYAVAAFVVVRVVLRQLEKRRASSTQGAASSL